MKFLINGMLSKVVGNHAIWGFLNWTVLRAARKADYLRQRRLLEGKLPPVSVQCARAAKATLKTFSDLTVRHGVFKGMRYPSARSTGSCLFPKLLGCYERELHPILQQAPKRGYSSVVDIGCAEGYYAVGLARMLPGVRVHAFDTDPLSRQFCREMAEFNAVGDRVEIGAWCDPKALLNLRLGRRALIFSDCEGFESALFTAEVIRALSLHDVVIETHDFINPDISVQLRKRFAATHHVAAIQSTDDADKATQYQYPEISAIPYQERLALLAEFRPAIMRWLVMTPRGS